MEMMVECQKRPEGSKTKALRRSGEIPANLYGHKGTESISLVINAKTVERLLKKASVNNTLIDLKINDIPWQGQTLLREVQAHPATGQPFHLSFFAVAGHGKMTVEVPLNFIGNAIGVKEEGGMLDTVITEMQLNCLPENIPDAIDIDVTNLKVGDSLHVNEIQLPEGVTLVAESSELVVSVLPPQGSGTTDDGEAEQSGASGIV
ncbi:50S ribosomal protein L25/general stress protein Ctc [Plectonema cf. radiosum LEGE 06105]|uniref:Large ribosomal subunit protein bL25 n=1 Tax=Plectonema cf. radiosum LEGE 06105 TaxID=945769 RepID=A0A8J7F1C5_9CYAN|nr:50S ribosomal protein L25/general stress protein Ctc [Plectonema radiosum]MBE9211863.1 50S ribosomal protein L25/general stress protein Ctc [Plectonema cf. radiosum LEGE 06105]